MSRQVTLLVALTVALGFCPVVSGNEQGSFKSGSKLSGHIRYSRLSPPESGVKLLEDIFIRVRSAPQVAMKQNNLKYQTTDVLAQAQGLTDNSLLIRPTQKGKTVGAPTPSLQIVQRVGTGINAYNNSTAATTRASASEPDNWMGSLYTPAASGPSQQGGKGYFWQAENEQEKAKIGMVPPPAAAPYTNSHAAFRDYNDSTPEQKNRPVPDLGTAVNKLAHLNKRLEQLQSRSNQPASDKDLREAPARPAEEVSFKKKERQQPGTNYGGVPRSLETVYGEEGAQYSRELKPSSLRRSRTDQIAMAGGGRAAPNMGGGFGAAGAPDEPVDALDEKTEVAKLALNNPNVIALLPPNVVTGIPLIRLGISERQANAALQEIGSMTQIKVNNWTVWSWTKPQTKSAATALQLYMRNGLLDAMRIFDRTLIAPDFGVTLGDSLAVVKEKFGEPAFILTEPTPGAGQNYIYPISQVGFQLARPSPNEPPRVVSVLIFNVK